MTIQDDLSHAFQLYEEKAFQASKVQYEQILEKELTIEMEIELRFGYGYPLSALGYVDEAVANYEKLGQLGEFTERLDLVTQSLHQIGMVYREAKQYKKALTFLTEEQKLIHNHFTNNPLFLAANLYEMGYTHFLDGNDEVAYSFLVDSLVEGEKAGDLIMLACSQRALGEFYQKQAKPKAALAYFEESIEMFKEAGDEIGAAEVVQMAEKLDMNGK